MHNITEIDTGLLTDFFFLLILKDITKIKI